MPTFSEIKSAADNANEIRKVLEAVAFLMPMSTALPATIFDTGGSLIELPVGAVPIGMVNQDGYTFTTEVEKAEVNAFGYSDPARTDYTRAPRQITFTMLQSLRKELLAFTNAVNLDNVVPGAHGEIVFDEAPIPQPDEYRLLLIGKDGLPGSEILQGRGYGRVKLAEIPEQAWASEDPQQYPCTLDVLLDSSLGTPVRHYIGGQGFDLVTHGYESLAAWQATTAYSTGDKATITGGTLECTTSGTSGSTEPTLPATVGDTVIDGSVGWTRIA